MSGAQLTGAAAAAKSSAEKPSEDLGTPPRLLWIKLDQLQVDRTYQRAMGKGNQAHANWILRHFSWLFYQPIVVAAPAKPGGAPLYTVIDGQHRLVAARKHPKISELPCYVVDGADTAAQAKAFVTINGRRIGITRLQRFWAALAAKDHAAVRVAALCHKGGIEIARTQPAMLPPRTTVATFSIEKLLPLGDAPIVMALRTIGDAHGSTGNAFSASMVVAMTWLVNSAGASFDRAGMIAVLRNVNLEHELQRAKKWRAGSGGSLAGALQACLFERYEARPKKRAA